VEGEIMGLARALRILLQARICSPSFCARRLASWPFGTLQRRIRSLGYQAPATTAFLFCLFTLFLVSKVSKKTL
jgi:hypothetical protein